ncbi:MULTISPECIES: hypothetical protein [unclassified Methanoculleus]|jgi:hypothetical protein|nr:hypothetical protein [Methanoculleus sp. UBA303]
MDLPLDYGSLLLEVEERPTRRSVPGVLGAVNKELVGLYRDIRG